MFRASASGRQGGSDPGPAGPRAVWPPPVYQPPVEGDVLAARIRARLVEYPDFPRPGIVFRDLMPILADPGLFRDVIDHLTVEATSAGAGSIAGIESRGFLFAAPLAARLGLPLFSVRKQGKLPGRTLQESYELEYGEAELEIQAGSTGAGDRVFLVDDLLATGGTLLAACRLVQRAGAEVAGLAVVVGLGALGGAARLRDYRVSILVNL